MARVVSALLFFPRGGSATVARALARELPRHGWETTVVSGSRPGYGDAESYYAGLDVRAAVFAPDGPVPMHPSYEDRPEAPDRVFAVLDDGAYEAQVGAWAAVLADAGAARADVLHLHHLTPIHEAAARVAPGVPVVGHLHGTELLMLEEIADGRAPATWSHAAAWSERVRRWAQGASRLVLLSESQRARAERLLGVDPARCVVLPNGVDPERFDRVEVRRGDVWRRVLADAPRGWAPGEGEGSVGYPPAVAEGVAGGTVVLFLGRFTAVKRVGLLVRAWARAEPLFAEPASLVIVGGHPGEWEGEHPLEAVRATGAEHVHLAGWYTHDELPGLLAAADLLVLPSVREQFGAVIVEAMACGLPAVAVNRVGPAEIVQDGETGWLVEPDDEEGLAGALVDAVNGPGERRRRGAAAHAAVRERYAWPAIAGRLAEVLGAAAREGR